MNLNRRGFLKVALAAGATTMAATGLIGCSSNESDIDEGAAESAGLTPDSAIECDVVICGGGLAGLSAAVQAVDSGLSAVLLEKAGELGGNGVGVEGIFGYNTAAQIEQGLDFNPGELVRHEIEFSQHRPNGVKILDLVQASADNYDWLVEHGVTFSGLVNDYGGLFPTMHWFEGDVAAVGFFPAMEQEAVAGGVDIRKSTSAKQLVVQDGAVKGVLAECEDGTILQVNAKGVILATGGWGSNAEMLGQMGWPTEHLAVAGTPGHDGDGVSMAVEVGAASMVEEACQLAFTTVAGMSPRSATTMAVGGGGPTLWVNRDGDRFIGEDHSAENMMSNAIPLMAQREIWCVANETTLSAALGTNINAAGQAGEKSPAEEIGEVVASCPDSNIFKCDTIAECAEKAGIDAANLQATIERYNELCDMGVDLDFGKNSALMLAMEEGPYYIYRLDPNILVTIGGLNTDRQMRVLDANHQPIAGLYAAGVDGNNLYRHVYPINVGATACGNNINSGRVAVKHIASALA